MRFFAFNKNLQPVYINSENQQFFTNKAATFDNGIYYDPKDDTNRWICAHAYFLQFYHSQMSLFSFWVSIKHDAIVYTQEDIEKFFFTILIVYQIYHNPEKTFLNYLHDDNDFDKLLPHKLFLKLNKKCIPYLELLRPSVRRKLYDYALHNNHFPQIANLLAPLDNPLLFTIFHTHNALIPFEFKSYTPFLDFAKKTIDDPTHAIQNTLPNNAGVLKKIIEGHLFHNLLSSRVLPLNHQLSFYYNKKNAKLHFKTQNDIASLFPSDANITNLSPDQLDACALILSSFSTNKGFIIADETGFGKGRLLAAIAMIFMNSNKNVVFITEKKELFSDFWRDLSALNNQIKPFLLHQLGIIYNQNGTVETKAYTEKNFKNALQNENHNFIFTTYSQFNKNLKNHPRKSFLEKQINSRPTLLILDESHNAAGDSQTSKNIKNFIQKADHVLFSSATFSKENKSLNFYESCFPKENIAKNILNLILDSNSETLGQDLSVCLVQNNTLIRREHSLNTNIQTNIIHFDTQEETDLFKTFDQFSLFLSQLHALIREIETYKYKLTGEVSPIWLTLGGILSRLSNQLLTLLKVKKTLAFIDQMLAENKKVVIALENTFEGFVLNLFDNNFNYLVNAEEENQIIDSEQSSLTSFDKKITKSPQELSFTANLQALLNSILTTNKLHLTQLPNSLQTIYQQTIQSTLPFASIFISPIDAIKIELSKKNIKVSEVSGRQNQLNETNGLYSLDKLNLIREKEIFEFNNNDTDVIIITKAGSTGISLHSSKDFKDSRKRAFLELQIANSARQRLQFLGRVRRNGQIFEPEYYTIVSKYPFEFRLIENALHKQKQVLSLASGSNLVNIGNIDTDTYYMSPIGNQLAYEFLATNPILANKMGIFVTAHQTSLQSSWIDRLLKRLPILTSQEQQNVLDFLNYGLQVNYKYFQKINQQSPFFNNNIIITESNFWGNDQKNSFDPYLILSTHVSQQVSISKEIIDKKIGTFKPFSIDSIKDKLKKYQHANPFVINNVKNLFNAIDYLLPNNPIILSHPIYGFKIKGLILGVSPPSDSFLVYPSCWKITVWTPIDDQTNDISLAYLFNDKHCTFMHNDNPQYVQQLITLAKTPKPIYFLQGNPLYLRWFNKIFEYGNILSFSTPFGSKSGICLLARPATPLLLISPKMTIECLKSETQIQLTGANKGDSVRIIKNQYGIHFCFSANTYALIASDFIVNKKLQAPHVKQPQEKGFIYKSCSFQEIYALIHLLFNRGFYFLAPNAKQNWYFNTLNKYFN